MEKVRLGDICTINGGYAFKSDQFSTEGVPVIRIGNITKEGLIIDENVCYDENFWNENDSYRIAKNDILIAMSGATVGKSCINNTVRKLLLNQRVAAINCDNNINLKYIFYSIDSEKFSKYIMTNSIGCAQPNISLKQIANFEIPAVCIEEQKRITDELDKLSNLIDKRKQQLLKLDDLVKAQFVELFGDPITNPMGWEKVNISAVVGGKVSNGFFAKRDEYCDSGNVKVLGVANVVNRMYSNTEELPQTNGTYADIQKYGVKYGDMLFCRSSLVAAGIGKASIVPKGVPSNVLFECHVIRLPLDLNKCVPEFMQVLSTTDYFRNQVISQSKTATMTTIGQDGILKTEIILPPLKLQKQFLSFVEQTDKSKLEVQKSLEKLELLKKALMQKYFG